ncbi:PREDICTED: cytochrome c oxidase assembly factor 7-like [Amphimedon queenslandica]|uniref:Beta-lactamase n=1 Tax=Amphimedon queenslandica TaxID=400682 RepID=A0A1X7V7S2_AMPQE|nr:PREDICTED: cytochrome c oxidase assembly factor 7-like [Amphimedon queenslandica]|eukprot:XP_003385413.1 PREDICTED: cytochrome c oxidase assembly factor 7-like [Amphimedon queenslandica]
MEPVEEKTAAEYLDKLGAVFHYDCYTEKKPEGCHQYAEYLIVAKKNPSKAFEVFSNCCHQMKFSESCLALGNMYLTGNGPHPKEFSKALQLFDTACELGSMGGCNNSGLVHQNGYEGQLPDYQKALQCFHRSCEGGFKNGCFNESIIYLQGKEKVPKDMSKALEYSLKSCELGHPWGCANASRMLKLGDGGLERNEKRAEELLKKAKQLSNLS